MEPSLPLSFVEAIAKLADAAASNAKAIQAIAEKLSGHVDNRVAFNFGATDKPKAEDA